MNSQDLKSSNESNSLRLPREFYQTDAVTLAQALIGKTLMSKTAEGTTGGIIVEAEAYMGHIDAAAHSFRASPNGRTSVMYGEGGYAYIYLIYGMHNCFNITANTPDKPEAVLIRALEPTVGIELMQKRRNMQTLKPLCNGPGKLCAAMGLSRVQYGASLCGDDEHGIWLEDTAMPAFTIEESKRINIDYAGAAKEYLWRFTMRGNGFLSRK